MKKMLCARGGHELTVPFFEISGISYTGNVAPEDMARVNALARWATHNEEGQPKNDAHYFCGEDFLELVEIMEAWREEGLAGVKIWVDQRLKDSCL